MTYRLIATYEPTNSPPGNAVNQPLKAWFSSSSLNDFAQTPGLTGFDILVPEDGKVRFFDDGPPPAGVVHLTAENHETLADLARSAVFRDTFLQAPQSLAGVSPDFGIFEVIATPVGAAPVSAAPDPDERRAALSFMVRYFEPIAEAGRFREFYITNHPPILARLPSVRNVFCYLPVETDMGDLPAARVVLGNEVVFDDLAALNAALSSNIMAELRDDSRNFPPFGSSSHHAMIRSQYFTPA